jgi:hypothetical protein
VGATHRRLAATLAAAWEAEVTAAQRMTALAEQVPAPGPRARLLVQAAFCRAHASRLLARLSTQGRGPLPVPPVQPEPTQGALEAILLESRLAQDAASRYGAAARAARSQGDLSSAWVCELNGTEEADRAAELRALARDVQQADLPGAFAV